MNLYLVTGASGFLGLNIVEQLLLRGDTVVGISRDLAPPEAAERFSRLSGRLIEIEADLSERFDFGAIIAQFRPAFVINAAAITPADDAPATRAATAIDINVVSSQRLFEAAAAYGVRCLFQPSSTSIYGAGVFGGHPPKETDAGAPASLYAFTKYTVERLALSFSRAHGLPVIAGRISSLFGPWERDTGVRDLLSPHLQLADIARSGGRAILEPNAARDWSYARDVARVILRLLDEVAPATALFNISCGRSWPFELWADALKTRHPDFTWRFAEDGEPASISYHGPRARPRQPLDIARLTANGAATALRPVAVVLEEYAEWLS